MIQPNEYRRNVETRGTGREPKDRSMPSIIGAGLNIEGNLKTTGNIGIQGRVNGDVEGKMVIVDRGGYVTGSIFGESVTVAGTVDGPIEASSVTLTATARVKGDLLHRTLAIEAGASVEGQFHQMPDVERAPVAEPAALKDTADSPAPHPSAVSAPHAA